MVFLDVLVLYLHILGFLILFGTLLFEHLFLHSRMLKKQIKRLAAVDLAYGLAAVLVLVTGLLLWFVVGKPAEEYTGNYLFHIKVTLFVIIGLISIHPTLFFLKHRKSEQKKIDVPVTVKWALRAQLVLLLLIPLLVALKQTGFGTI